MCVVVLDEAWARGPELGDPTRSIHEPRHRIDASKRFEIGFRARLTIDDAAHELQPVSP